MSKITIFCNIFLIIFLCQSGQSQRFNFGVKGGLNFAQVNGDGLAGYDKFGLEGGVRSVINFESKWDMVVELLYSQRGSSDQATFRGGNSQFSLIMDYIAIPVLIEFKDWEVTDDDRRFFRMHFNGGLAFGRLFNIESMLNGGVSTFGDDYNTNDLSIILGIDYYFNRHFSVNLRYTRSMIPLDRVELNGEPDVAIIPHHVTLGASYMFF